MSVSRPLLTALMLIAALAIAGPAYLVSLAPSKVPAIDPADPAYPPPKPVSRGALLRFEDMATQACHCARGRQEEDIDACWAEFDRTTAPYNPFGEAYACEEADIDLCFSVQGEDRMKCLKINRRTSGACSAEEKRQAEAGGCGG